MTRTIFLAACVIWLSTGALASQHTNELRAAVSAFVSSLDAAQRKSASYSLEDDTRATWSNLPILMAPPAGVLLKDLNDAQRATVHDMLRASLSSQGYAKSVAIMWLDDVLGEIETARLKSSAEARSNRMTVAMAANRDSGHYAVAVFGDPSGANWGWKITGHHLAVNITVAGDRIGFTPVFLGSNPRVVGSGRYAGWMALPMEGAMGVELMQALTPDQQEAARLDEAPQDVVEGPGRRASLETFRGASAKNFTGHQLELLQRLVDEYVRHAKASSADVLLEAVATAGWDKLWFSWAGSVDTEARFYYRVHGPRILIEYNRQNENHDHAVVRDPTNDYGEDWLEHHYKEFHPPMDEVMKDVQRRIGESDAQ